MNPALEQIQLNTRRHFLRNCGVGLGSGALAQMLSPDAFGLKAPGNPLLPRKSHFSSKAKRVIYIHLTGSPPHLDLWDYKPELVKRTDQECPDEFIKGKKFAFTSGTPKLMGTPRKFSQHGKSGMWMSDAIPHLHKHADDLCVIKSMHTDQFNHAPAQMMMLSGFQRFGRPSIGAWTSYGLGSENKNLPSFVVLVTGQVLGAGNSAWGSGFLPTVHQGVEFRSQGDPVLFLSNPKGIEAEARKRTVDAINELNQRQLLNLQDPEIATRIDQYELAYRMQSSVPELMEIESESKETHAMYGTEPGKSSFANNCLLARRLVERGVRFVQLFDQGWDMHNSVANRLPTKCKQVDRPIAALIKDLKRRGLLDETLVIWSSEFGRTPMGQGDVKAANVGRDHHKEAFTTWMAGGGVKKGFVYGKSDELGYGIAEDPMHVHDFNATIMHLLGIDHEQLTFKYQGRPYRLTDIGGVVAEKIIA